MIGIDKFYPSVPLFGVITIPSQTLTFAPTMDTLLETKEKIQAYFKPVLHININQTQV